MTTVQIFCEYLVTVLRIYISDYFLKATSCLMDT